ncbi:MAG: cyclic nucleotide-binding domain-containing protein [bacterium]
MVPTKTLKELNCLKEFDDQQIEKLAQISVEKTCPADSHVLKANEVADALYIVISGRVAIEIDLPRNRKIVIDFVERGDFFGWSALVSPYLMTASSLSVEESVLIRIPREPLIRLMSEDISIKASMMEMLTQVVATRLKDTRLQLTYLLGWD